jgi:hypothetical protein
MANDVRHTGGDGMTDRKRSDASRLDGSELTHELFSDVYMAGTSDGVQQLAEGSVVVEPESYEANTSETKPAENGKKP